MPIKQEKPGGQAAESPESAEDKESILREISEDELKQILEDHKKWLESNGKEGRKADLRRANLKNANFHRTNLEKAILCEANLQDAYFSESNLQNTDLSKADMQNTTFDQVNNLAEANLLDANLEGATGLLGDEFARANATGTKLPDDIKEFKPLEAVEKTSQNARKIFFAMLLGCVYSWLTIATTTDVLLLTNTASSPLPIIGTEIPIAAFYWAAPFVLVGIFIYFHFYLIRLWEDLAGLPAIFPDGKRLDQKAYPWLLNSLVRRHFRFLKDRPKTAKLEEFVTIFLAWWAVPLTFIGFWLRYLPRHEWIGTWLHIGLIVLTICLAIIFYSICVKIFRGEKKYTILWKSVGPGSNFTLTSIGLGMLIFVISYCAINKFGFIDPRLGAIVANANFVEKNVSERPSDYWRISEKDRI